LGERIAPLIAQWFRLLQLVSLVEEGKRDAINRFHGTEHPKPDGFHKRESEGLAHAAHRSSRGGLRALLKPPRVWGNMLRAALGGCRSWVGSIVFG